MRSWWEILKSANLPGLLKAFKSIKPPKTNFSNVEDLYTKVIRDPFSCRNDLNVQEQYKILKNLNSKSALNDSDRVLLEKLGSDYRTFVNETPHLFFNSILNNTILFKTPAHVLLNPEDYKCGDLAFLEKDNNLAIKVIECKTFERLSSFSIIKTCQQFKRSKNLEEINFSIIYREPVISEKRGLDIFYTNLKINPEKVNFISLEKLSWFSTRSNIDDFFRLYRKLNYEEYNLNLLVLRNLLIDKVILNTDNLLAVEGLKKHQKQLNQTKTTFFKIPKRSKFLGFVETNGSEIVDVSESFSDGGVE